MRREVMAKRMEKEKMVAQRFGATLARHGRAPLVIALGELRRWRLMHEPDLMDECLCCGMDVELDRDSRGRLWKVHTEAFFRENADAECMNGCRVPPEWSLKTFQALRLSTPLRHLEKVTQSVRTEFCPGGGQVGDHFCYRSYGQDGVVIEGYR